VLSRILRGEFALGLTSSLLLRGFGACLSLLVSIVLARLLGVEGFGTYAYCLAIVTLLAVPAQFGIGTVLVRFCAAYQSQQEWSLLKGLLRWSNKIVVISSLGLVLLAAVIFWTLPRLRPDGDDLTLWLALLMLPIYALGELRAAALRGFRRFVLGQLPELVVRPVGLLVILATMSRFDAASQLSAASAMAAYLAASIVAFLLGAWWLWRALPPSVNSASGKTDVPTWRNAVGVLSVTRGGRVVLSRIDVIVVGALIGAEAAGIYRVASTLAGVLGFGLSAVNAVSAPFFSRMHAIKDRAQLRKLLVASSIISLILAIPIAGALVGYGSTVLTLVYGEAFSAAYVPLLVLLVGQFVNAAAGSAGAFLNMTGQERWSLFAVIIALGISTPSYFLLVPKFGVIGAAGVTSGALAMLNIILGIKAWMSFTAESQVRNQL